MQLLKQVKQLSGKMDLDTPNEDIPSPSHRNARNIVFRGKLGRNQPQINLGTRILPNQLSSAGEVTIGRFRDQVNMCMYFFNWSPTDNHAIYRYSLLDGSFDTVIRNGVGNAGDVLVFLIDSPIEDIDILYQDETDGDLLCWLDSLGKPCKINVMRYIQNTYPNVKKEFLDVIKAPPVMPPRVVYENDYTITVNNCLNSLFIFAYAWVYDDNEWSVLSSGSKQPKPVHTFSNDGKASDPTQDCRIALYLETGDVNVKKIRIYVKQTQNGTTSDWLLVDSISKAEGGIADNSVYKYSFYNNGNYTPEDTRYTTSLQDWVPDNAKAQAVINGNVLSYYNILEGYDWFKTVYSNQIRVNPSILNINGYLFFGYADGTFTGNQPNFTFVFAGAFDAAGTNYNGTVLAGDIFVNAISDGGDISFSVANQQAVSSVATLLTNIANAATGAGWTLISNNPATKSLRIYYPTGTVILKSTYYQNQIAATAGAQLKAALFEGAAYSWALVYFDKNGKTSGAMTDVTANIVMPKFTSSDQYYGIILNLAGIIPPPWAVSYALMRTDNLTYSKYLGWISSRTFSGVGTTVLDKYAYLDITNIDDYNDQANATQAVIKYDFQEGDRVRINFRYPPSGPGLTFVGKDYAVVGLAINPIVNGQQQTGRFVKILYPATDINPTYDFPDTNNAVGGYTFANYNITLYHVLDNAAGKGNAGVAQGEGNVYFEVGEKYMIGNPGLNTAYHFGNIGDNRLMIQEGDVFYRSRTIPCGTTYFINSAAVAFSGPWFTAPISLNPPDTQVTVGGVYTVGPQTGLAADPYLANQFPRFSDSGGMFNNLQPAAASNIRLRGEFNVSSSFVTWVSIYVKLVNNAGQVRTIPIIAHSEGVGNSVSIETITVKFDQLVNVPAGYKAWLILGNGVINSGTTNTHFNGFIIRLDVVKDFAIKVYDKSYSDIYNLVTNSDNRPQAATPNQRRTQYEGTYRWGQADQAGTELNGSNRFFFEDFDDALLQYGPIQKATVLGKLLHIFQSIKCGTVGIYQKYISNNEGANALILNDKIIEKNNIHYAVYEGGVGGQKSSIFISNYAHYFVNPVKGHLCRWSNDGVEVISMLYDAQTWAGNNLVKYNKNYSYQFGGTARCIGVYREYKNKEGEYMLMTQGGQNATGETIPGETMNFDESENAFTSFHDINCDTMMAFGNDLYLWLQGKLYILDDEENVSTYFGVKYPASVTLVFNEQKEFRKTYYGIGYQANAKWGSPTDGDVNTDSVNSLTGFQQQSCVLERNYDIVEGITYAAAFNRDVKSRRSRFEALNNGDYLKGVWIEVKHSYNGTKQNILALPYVTAQISQRNF